jgi:hypothetical protein
MVVVGLLLLATATDTVTQYKISLSLSRQLRRLAGKSLASRLAALGVQLRPYLQPNKARFEPCVCLCTVYARVSGNTRSVTNLRRI